VHVLIATYNEPAELVRECVLRLLVAPEPLYMEKACLSLQPATSTNAWFFVFSEDLARSADARPRDGNLQPGVHSDALP
jgi:hypothetical protein